MYSKEELEELINGIAGKAERNSKTMEAEAVIAQLKADILQNVGKQISMLTLVEMFGKTGIDALSPATPIYAGDHVAFQIAEAAEMIMRRAWIEKK
jgi:hypothetical protein